MLRPLMISGVILGALHAPVYAVPPGAALVPGGATKFHASIPDVPKLKADWEKTKLSKMFSDPKLKNFWDDLSKESPIAKLGLTWDDLSSVAKGEMSLSTIMVAPNKAGHAFTLYAKEETVPLMKMLAKVAVSMEKQGYKVGLTKISEFPITTYHRGATEKGKRDETLYNFVKDQILVGTDDPTAVALMLQRWKGDSADRLDQSKAYQQVLASAKDKTKIPTDLFWFAEPLGLAEAERGNLVSAPRRGPDLLKILKEEGFTALQGMGGFVSLGLDDYDILHHTAIYAPGPYEKSMRMVRTLPGGDFAPPAWVPGDAARFLTAYIDIANAFDNFGSFFDAYYGEGDVGTFNDIMKGLRDDPNGPQLDVAKEIIGRLGQRVDLVVQSTKPVVPNGACSVLAAETHDEKGLAQAIRRLNENDEDIKPHTLGDGTVVWEMITKEKKKKKGAKPAPPTAKPPNTGMAVAHGRLFVANDVKFLDKILAAPDKGLESQPDYQLTVKEIAKLGAGKDCLRSFARPDEEFETVYEMLRTNQIHKSNSLYAKLLVSLFGDNVKQLDGSKTPAYENFRPYLGATGLYAINQPDGWFEVGWVLRKK